MNETIIDKSLDTISDWGIAKRYRRYSDVSQVINLDEDVGQGYFEHHDFEKISLSKLNCTFNHAKQMSNDNTDIAYILYFVLQGHYEFVVGDDTCEHTDDSKQKPLDNAYRRLTLSAPSLWLLRGSSTALTAHIEAHTRIKGMYVAMTTAFIDTLTEQLANQPYYQHSLLQHFVLQQSSEVHIPFSDTANDVFHKAWQLFDIPAPTDEISLLSLQGETFCFLSDLLRKPYAHMLANNDNVPTYALQARLLIDQFYSQNWSIKELAKKVNTNESYLKKHFKTLTGMSINDYRTRLRMQKAKQLLAEGVTSHDVAHKLGFSSHHYFKKIYKKYNT